MNSIVDEMLRAIAAELPPGRLRDWLLAQQSEAPGRWEAHVDVRELTPANAEAVLAAIRRIAAQLEHGHNPHELPDEFADHFRLLAQMVDAADRGEPPMDLNPYMREVIPPRVNRSGPGWEHHDAPGPRDRVKDLVEHAAWLLDGNADPVWNARFLADLESLPPRELVRFDSHARAHHAGLSPKAIARRRRRHRALWEVLALVSGNGHERERGIRETRLAPLTARLLAIRATDWVREVRAAALERLDECPLPLLIEALPLVDQLVVERIRGDEQKLLLERRLSEEALRQAARAPGPRIRRAAWRRLIDRDAVTAEVLVEAAGDEDVGVRILAASALARLEPDARRAPAQVLVDDPVGAVAVPALNVLVALDGVAAIRPALTGRSAGVRRAARGWAAVRGVDARAVYLERGDALGLMALAEIGDARDARLFREMIDDDRARVRAAGLRALGRVDHREARAIAVEVLRAGASGRMLWAATDVLRGQPPSAAEAEALAPVVLDADRAIAQRLRALSLLRPMRWLHLATILQARAEAEDAVRAPLDAEVGAWIRASGRIGRGPTGEIRELIERRLPELDRGQRRQIEFVLRTSA